MLGMSIPEMPWSGEYGKYSEAGEKGGFVEATR